MQFINFPPMNIKVEGMDQVKLPRMINIRQRYDDAFIEDIAGHVSARMDRKRHPEAFAGKRICVTVGSRGIPHLDVIVRTVLDKLKQWGAQPFLVPAMGSHGGATAEGQLEVLETYHITSESMGVPILSSMDVVRIGALPDGTPVYCDKFAAQADGIVILNKVKPHTDFRAKHESGLAKMMAIGLGKHKGASQFHMKGFSTFAQRIPQVCRVFMDTLPIAFGVGIVQNAYDKISYIEVAEPEELLEKDAQLLEIAKNSLPKFKLNHFDVLIIDRIGKNISGNGADPNITGRANSPGFEDILDVKKIFIRGLTEETNHNGCGICHADVTTRRCLNSIDFETSWVNCITATMLRGGAIPLYMENDRDALMLAVRTCNGIDFDQARIVRIQDTLHMENIAVSEAFSKECEAHPEIDVLSQPYEMQFDADGFLL